MLRHGGMQLDFGGTERFEIRSLLGRGGMGVVYEAFDREKKALVALKTLHHMDAQSLYRLKKEFRALQGLEHPNLVDLGELIEAAGVWFFTMELVRGADFLSYVWRTQDARSTVTPGADVARTSDAAATPTGDAPVGPHAFDEPRLRTGLRQLAQGLAALHAAGKVHRDVKPSNILVDEADRVVLLDFGLIAETHPEKQSTGTQVVGTAAYMAPEQALCQTVGPAADWYGVGVILYQALTGQLPFAGPQLMVLLDKQRLDPLPPSKLSPTVPADLDALCAVLLRRSPEERPAGTEILERLGAEPRAVRANVPGELTQTPPFVGRENDLRALQRAFEDVREGQAITVYVHGASGVGKSALIRHFADWAAEERGSIVLAGRCYEQESVPYKALDGVVDALSRYLRRLRRVDAAGLVPRYGTVLPRIFPVLGRVPFVAEAPPLQRAISDPHEIRRHAFAALRDLLGRMTERSPVVVVIDDLQWADLDSYTLLHELLRPPDAPPLLLLVSSREGKAEAERRQQATDERAHIPGEVRHLELDALPEARAIDLARLLLERAGLDVGDNARSIATEAAGHPLYIDELVRHARITAREPSERVRLDDVIWRRVCDLPEPMRAVLEVVCLAVAPLPQETIRQAARLDRPEFTKQVSVLRISRLVRGKGLRDDDTVEPYHDRVREAVASHLSEQTSTEAHRRLVTALRHSLVAERRPDVLVHHLAAIGEQVQAAEYAESGANRAANALAFDRAVDLYRRAVQLRALSGEVPYALRASLARALCMAGRRAEAATSYIEAAETAPPAQSLEYRRLAADAYLISGHLDEGLATLRVVLRSAMVPLPRRSGWRATLSMLVMRAILRLRGMRFGPRDTTELSARELRRIEVCWSAAAGLAMVDPIRGVEYSTRHLLLSLRAGVKEWVAKGLGMESGYASAGGPRTARRSKALLSRMRELAGDDHFLQVWHRFASVIRCYQLGQFRSAAALAANAMRTFESLAGADVAWELVNVRLWHLWSLYYLGAMEELSRRVPALLRDATERGDLYAATNFCTGVPAVAWLVRDDPDGMSKRADEHIARWSRESFHLQHYWHFLSLQNGRLYTDDRSALSLSFSQEWSTISKSWILRVPLVRMEVYDLRARSALAAAGDAQGNAELLRAAESDSKRIERTEVRPCASALASSIRAGVASLRGDLEGARRCLERAVEAADEAAMAAHAAVARRRLGELVGGDEGAALIAQAESWMRDQTIANPARFARMLTPGFDS